MDSLQLPSNRVLQKVNNPNYDPYINQYISYCQQFKLTIDSRSLSSYLNFCKDVYAPATLNVTKAALKKSLKQTYLGHPFYHQFMTAIEEIFKEIRVVKTDKKIYSETVLTDSEIEALYHGKIIKNSASGKKRHICLNEKHQLLMQFLLETGMRISEALAIQLKDCRHQGEYTYIEITGKGKKKRRNIIPFPLFQDICHQYQSTTYLFEEPSFLLNGKMDLVAYRHNFKNRLSYYSKIVIGRKITPHDFRHYFATRWLKNGKSLKAIANWLGHSTTAITADMYIHDELSPEELFN